MVKYLRIKYTSVATGYVSLKTVDANITIAELNQMRSEAAMRGLVMDIEEYR